MTLAKVSLCCTLKSSFRSQDGELFVLTFMFCRKKALLEIQHLIKIYKQFKYLI